MKNNKKIGLVVVGILVLAGVFYGGVVYGKSKTPARGMGNFTRTNGTGTARMGNQGGMGGFTTGQVISKDDSGITVSIMGGGSKIIFLNANTKIYKQASGATADLAVGTQVTVTGTPNSDGSLNAQSVQIRPNMPQGAKVQ